MVNCDSLNDFASLQEKSVSEEKHIYDFFSSSKTESNQRNQSETGIERFVRISPNRSPRTGHAVRKTDKSRIETACLLEKRRVAAFQGIMFIAFREMRSAQRFVCFIFFRGGTSLICGLRRTEKIWIGIDVSHNSPSL